MKVIFTKYHGPTTFKGSRISASDSDNNRATVSYRSELNSDENHTRAAIALCEKMGWSGTLVAGDLKSGRVYVWLEGAEQIKTQNSRPPKR